MSEFESMKEAMQPILDAQTEQTEEWCEKHQRPKVRVKRRVQYYVSNADTRSAENLRNRKPKLVMSVTKKESGCIILKILA